LPMIAFTDESTDARIAENALATVVTQRGYSALPAASKEEDATTLPLLSEYTEHLDVAVHGTEAAGETAHYHDVLDVVAPVAGADDDQDPMLKAARRFAARSSSEN